jgi:DNA-binding response OmpR family regulator
MARILLTSHSMPDHPAILLIEDSLGECELFRIALASTGIATALLTLHDREAALKFLKSMPKNEIAVILLDWRLGNQSGVLFLKAFRAEHRFAGIPVIIFTTSDEQSDVAAAYANGANGYIVKPETFEQLVPCIADICHFWIDRNRLPHMANVAS